MNELLNLAVGNRLVTVTGPGGSGKTRVLQEVAPSLVDRLAADVCWVDLAPVQSPAAVVRAVAAALKVGAQAGDDALADLLSEHLRSRSVALLVDNCEHLIEDVGELVDLLLSGAENLVVVAASREPLHVTGEVVYRLGPMTDGEAVALFVERARALVSQLTLDDALRRTIGDICAQLDGMPLAIELAAPWLRLMSAEDLRSALADRFSLLASATRGVPARQRTLLAAVEWSHERLSADERTLFRRLAVFSGSFSLAAVEAVCGDDELADSPLVQLLSLLCDRSMVVADPSAGHGSRFHLLETLRQFGLQQLDGSADADRVRRRHFEHYLGLAETGDELIRTTGSDAALVALVPELDNIRSALRWSLEQDPEGALRLCGAIDHLWPIVAAAEGARWLEDALARTRARTSARARALAATVLVAVDESGARARDRVEESVAIAQELGDADREAWGMHMLGMVAWLAGDLTAARVHSEHALALHERTASPFAMERTRWQLGCVLVNIEGESKNGVAHLLAARTSAAELHDTWCSQYATAVLAQAALDAEDADAARSYLVESLSFGDRGVILAIPAAAAARLVSTTEPGRAAVLLGAARAINERTAGRAVFHLAACNHARAEATYDEVAAKLGPRRLATSWEQGRALTSEQALIFALETLEEPRSRTLPGGLTSRESDVVRLVAGGLANKEIARALSVSVRTVEAHLDHVFSKLGLNSRTRLAAWARDAHLVDRDGNDARRSSS